MIEYCRIFARAFLIVVLTAANVRLIGRGLYLPAFLTGCGISWVWWANSRTAAHSPLRGAGVVYGVGAGCGTAVGMWLGGLL